MGTEHIVLNIHTMRAGARTCRVTAHTERTIIVQFGVFSHGNLFSALHGKIIGVPHDGTDREFVSTLINTRCTSMPAVSIIKGILIISKESRVRVTQLGS